MPAEPHTIPGSLDFPVVGIGASAGGLPALLQLFENMPSVHEMAFVIVLHLSPKHASSAGAILQRATRMPVAQPRSRVQIERGHVYVIAANQQLSMMDGLLVVDALERPRSRHVAIDLFFRTLAEAHRERAVAIMLSGTGADGAVGLARVKEQGGVTIAQAPGDAGHDGMPAAILAGAVDFVLPVVEIPQKLMDLWSNASAESMSAESMSEFVISVDKKNRIYRARGDMRAPYHGPQAAGGGMRLAEAARVQLPGKRQFSFADLHGRALAQCAPPSVMVDAEGSIVHMSDGRPLTCA